MAQLIINFPDDDTYRDSIAGVAERYGYRIKTRNEAGEVIDNPQNMEDFAKEQIAGEIKKALIGYRTRLEQASVAAKVAAAVQDIKIG